MRSVIWMTFNERADLQRKLNDDLNFGETQDNLHWANSVSLLFDLTDKRSKRKNISLKEYQLNNNGPTFN